MTSPSSFLSLQFSQALAIRSYTKFVMGVSQASCSSHSSGCVHGPLEATPHGGWGLPVSLFPEPMLGLVVGPLTCRFPWVSDCSEHADLSLPAGWRSHGCEQLWVGVRPSTYPVWVQPARHPGFLWDSPHPSGMSLVQDVGDSHFLGSPFPWLIIPMFSGLTCSPSRAGCRPGSPLTPRCSNPGSTAGST